MATYNFHSVSGKYYVFDDEHFWFYDWDEYISYDNRSETIDNLQASLQLSFGKMLDISDFNINNELRSYSSSPVGRITFRKYYWDYSFEMVFHIVMRSWYYSWANVDVYVEYFVNWEWEYDNIDDMIDAWWWYWWECSKAKYKQYLNYFTKSASKAYDAIHDKLDKVLTEATDTKLVKLWQFSNWEAVYKQI